MSTAAPTDLELYVARYMQALPDHLRAHLALTATLRASLAAAHRQQWTVAQLAHETTRDLTGAASFGAIATTRLRRIAADRLPPPSAVTTGRPVFRQPKPPCGQCDPAGRWAPTEPGQPARRCSCWTDPRDMAG